MMQEALAASITLNEALKVMDPLGPEATEAKRKAEEQVAQEAAEREAQRKAEEQAAKEAAEQEFLRKAEEQAAKEAAEESEAEEREQAVAA